MKNLFKNINFRKTFFICIILCFFIVVIVGFVQYTGQSKVNEGCSYLDPITIDILAFGAALFLIIEGFFKIIKNFNASLKNQATRIVRIMLGCSIIVIHVLQIMHK